MNKAFKVVASIFMLLVLGIGTASAVAGGEWVSVPKSYKSSTAKQYHWQTPDEARDEWLAYTQKSVNQREQINVFPKMVDTTTKQNMKSPVFYSLTPRRQKAALISYCVDARYMDKTPSECMALVAAGKVPVDKVAMALE